MSNAEFDTLAESASTWWDHHEFREKTHPVQLIPSTPIQGSGLALHFHLRFYVFAAGHATPLLWPKLEDVSSMFAYPCIPPT